MRFLGLVGKKNPIKDKSGLKVEVLTSEIVTWGLQTLGQKEKEIIVA